MDDLKAGSYTRGVLSVLIAGVLLLGLNVFMADPYGTFHNLGLRKAPRDTIVWSRVAAAERIRSGCDIVFLGSSRVVFGLGPHMPRWPRMQPCNGAMGGTSLVELEAAMDLALQQERIQHVVMFIGLHMFDDGRVIFHDYPQSLFNDDRSRLSYYAWSLTSLEAMESAATVRQRLLPWQEPPTNRLSNPLKANYTQLASFLKPERGIYDTFQGTSASMERFRGMLDRAQASGKQVTLVIPAIHAMQFEMMADTGLWDDFQAWQQALVAELEHREDAPVLWSFAAYHHYATDPVPTSHHEKASPWWIDISHQSRKLGNLTLLRIYDAVTGEHSRDWDPLFGVRLTSPMLPAHHEALDAGRQTWRQTHTRELAWYEETAEKITAPDARLAQRAGDH